MLLYGTAGAWLAFTFISLGPSPVCPQLDEKRWHYVDREANSEERGTNLP